MAKQYLGGGQWVEVQSPDDNSGKSSNPTPSSSSSQGTSSDSGNQATKDFRDIEKFVLVGDGDIYPEVSLKAKATVMLTGLGDNLTGLYYVDQVKRTWGKEGFSETIQVSRNALGNSVKSGVVPQPTPTPPPPSDRPEVTPTIAPRTHTLQYGDTLWGLAVEYYQDGTQWTKIADANGIERTTYATTHVPVGKVLTIP